MTVTVTVVVTVTVSLKSYGGSRGAETILTSKYSESTSSVSKMVDFGHPGAEKLIFSDKTSASLNDCSPKLIQYI